LRNKNNRRKKKMEDVIQKYLGEKYDKELVDLINLTKEAYARGLKEGEETAKASIIALIKGENK
jgi:hypothetical protein